MHNTYISSSSSLWTKGSLSFSFSDYSYYLRNERFEKSPLISSCCQSSCCNCCVHCIQPLPINPRSLLLYGLRQSALIQCSPSRKLVVGCDERYYNRVPVCGVRRDCYGVSCCVKESRVVTGRRGIRDNEFGCMDLEKLRKCSCSSSDVEADVILSLLIDEGEDEECYGVPARGGGFEKRMQMEKKGNVSDQCYMRKKKKNVESGYLQSKSKTELESVTCRDNSRKEGYNRIVENDGLSRNGHRRSRTKDSSSSSFYSALSSGDFENEMEVKNGGYLIDYSSSHKKDMQKISEGRTEVKEFGRQRFDIEKRGEVLNQQTTDLGLYKGKSNAEWDFRKTSEKTLNDVSIDKNEELNLEETTKKHHSQINSQITGESTFRTNNHQRAEVHTNISNTTSGSQKQFHNREENTSAATNLTEETRKYTNNDATTYNSQKHDGRFEIVNSDVARHSNLQRQTETRAKKQVEQSNLIEEARKEQLQEISEQSSARRNNQQMSNVSNLIEEARKEQLQEISEQSRARRNYQQMSNVSYSRDDKISSLYSQLEARMKKLEENSNIISSSHWQLEGKMKNLEENSYRISSSYPEAKEQRFDTDRIGSQVVTSTSVVHGSGTEKTSSSRVSEVRVSSKEKNLSSTTNIVEEISGELNQTDARQMKNGSTNVTQRPTQLSSFHENTSEVGSSLQASLNFASQSTLQQVFVQNIDNRISQTMLIPPPRQMAESGSLSIEGTAGLTTEEVSRHTLKKASALHDEVHGGSKRSEIYGEPVNPISHDDTLGSADRLEKSSQHFMGEFSEKLRQEVSSSQISKENKNSKAKSGKLLQGKEHDSRKSSGVSKAKGPSDEMWDVTESSVQEPTKTEETSPEGFTTGNNNTIVKRNSKSLWGIIADVIRLRWGPQSDHRSPTVKLSVRSSSHESSNIDTWFSGHEADEDNDENAIGDKRKTLQKSTSADQPQLGKAPSTSPEGSVSDRINQGMVNTFSSPKILETGSTHGGTSYVVPGKGPFSSSGNEQNTPPSTAIVESPLKLRRSQVVDEFSGNGKVGVCESGLPAPTQNTPSSPAIVEESPLTLSSSSKQLRRSPVVGEFSGTGIDDLRESGLPETTQNTPFIPAMVESPLTLSSSSRQLKRSPIVGEFSGTDRESISESSSFAEQQKMLQQSVGWSEGSETEGKDGELKKRKLQRKKQVPHDRFDEWEEAYTQESELRKLDEMFMREALLEANKAAEAWEVPVGAVLVQHGKIVARGYNLVEELRDSTAHAEMICIREASNVLQSWRLAETTLYVTLEPCPMCAGAILQARVDTIVWGAPNKLLGADGSWIRLFPNGGGNGLELTDKPLPPVHPFHPNITVRRGVLASECADIMQQFFQLRRKKKEKIPDPPPLPSPRRHSISLHPSKILTKVHNIFNVMFCL